MPIRNQIEAIVQTLPGSPQFIYGSANELNHLADDTSFPCVFMYPIQPIEIVTGVNGSVNNTFTLSLEFLFQTAFDQYTADNEIYVSQALHLANQFIVKATSYTEGDRRYFRIKAGEKARCVPVYNKFDVNATGVNLTVTLNTMYSETFN